MRNLSMGARAVLMILGGFGVFALVPLVTTFTSSSAPSSSCVLLAEGLIVLGMALMITGLVNALICLWRLGARMLGFNRSALPK